MHFHIVKMYKDKEGEAGILLHMFGKFMILKLKSSRYKSTNDADEAASVVSLTSSSGGYINGRNSENLELCYWTRAIKRFALFDLFKSLFSDTKIFSKYMLSLHRR
jgi:hypothetical protein